MGKKKMVQWQIKNLSDEKTREKYSEDTNNAVIEESQTIKERWQNLKDAITMTEMKTLGHSNITTRKEWITTEIVSMIKEKRKYKSSNSAEGQGRYKVLKNLIIRKSREAKEKYLEERCSEIETFMKRGSREEAYKMVKKFFG